MLQVVFRDGETVNYESATKLQYGEDVWRLLDEDDHWVATLNKPLVLSVASIQKVYKPPPTIIPPQPTGDMLLWEKEVKANLPKLREKTGALGRIRWYLYPQHHIFDQNGKDVPHPPYLRDTGVVAINGHLPESFAEWCAVVARGDKDDALMGIGGIGKRTLAKIKNAAKELT